MIARESIIESLQAMLSCIACFSAFTAVVYFIEVKKSQQTKLKNKVRVVRHMMQMQICFSEVVVGDLVLLGQGDTVPADCVVVQQTDLVVTYYNQTKDYSSNLTLKTDSVIVQGQCKAIACQVGKMGEQCRYDHTTPFQRNLEQITSSVKIRALIAAVCVLAASVLRAFAVTPIEGDNFLSVKNLLQIFHKVEVCIALLTVMTPMCLAIICEVVISFNDLHGFLNNGQQAFEKAGSLYDVVGDLSMVTQDKLEPKYVAIKLALQKFNGISYQTRQLLSELIIANSSVWLDIDDETQTYVCMGCPVDVAMASLVNLSQFNERNLILNLPFCPSKATQVVAYRKSEYLVRIVVKGAPESVIPNCDRELDLYNQQVVFDGNCQALDYICSVIKQDYDDVVKPITYAFKDVTNSEFQRFVSRDMQLNNLVLAATFFLKLSANNDAAQCIVDLWDRGTNTRIVSSEHKQTVIKTAIKLGIAEPGWQDNHMTGEEFKILMNQLMFDNGYSYEFVDEMAKQIFQHQIKNKVQIISRACPDSLQILVAALSKSGSSCGVVDDKLQDLQRLDTDVIFSSDSIVQSNQILGVLNSVQWSRNVYDIARKFLMFHVTASVSCAVVVFISYLTLGQSPFQVTQLVWIKLIVDLCAALAFSQTQSQQMKRTNYNQSLIPTQNLRFILVQISYQVLVMIGLIFSDFFGTHVAERNQMKIHQTFMFHTFVLMNVANIFNCAELPGQKQQIPNPRFVIAVSLILILQFSSTQLFGVILGNSKLNLAKHVAAVGFGIGSTLVRQLSTYILHRRLKSETGLINDGVNECDVEI